MYSRTHFGVTINGEVKTFCGTDKIGLGETEDKYTAETYSVTCYECESNMSMVAHYALHNSKKIPQYVKMTSNGYRATW